MHRSKLSHSRFAAAAFLLAWAISPSLAHAETAGQYIDDTAITTKVKAAIVGDAQLKDTSISVETTQASVQLSGAVDNKTQENEAIHVASQVSGVRNVQDMLTIRATEAP